jgi:hypothetical protein
MQNNEFLKENLEQGDLKRLVNPEIHIDQYKSKMGDDADIVVLSLKVKGKEPSTDLVNFIEKGYDFVLDADVSSGEKEDGDYLVFVEISRTEEVPEQIMKLMEDLMSLTDQSMSDYKIKYRKSNEKHPLSQEVLERLIPLTPEDYKMKFDKEQKEIEELKMAAGVDVESSAPINDFTESLRRAAGIK